MTKQRSTKNAEYCHRQGTICPLSVPNPSKRTKRPTSDLNDISLETIEKIDIARLKRFICENCCLTEETQYKIMLSEATQRLRDGKEA
jgi:hypothetical protein